MKKQVGERITYRKENGRTAIGYIAEILHFNYIIVKSKQQLKLFQEGKYHNYIYVPKEMINN